MKRVLLFLISFFLIIACNKDETPEKIEEARVESELEYFNYEMDLEAETFTMEYKIIHTNLSSFDVKGTSRVELTTTDPEEFTVARVQMPPPCPEIKAGESCVEALKETGELGVEELEDPENFQWEIAAYYFIVTEEIR